MRVRTSLISRISMMSVLLAAWTGIASAQTQSASPLASAGTSLVVEVPPGVDINQLAAQLGLTVTRSVSSNANGTSYVVTAADLGAAQQALAASGQVNWVDVDELLTVDPQADGETVLPLDCGETVLPLDGGSVELPLGPGYSTVTTTTVEEALSSVLETLDCGETVLPLGGGTTTVLPVGEVETAYEEVANLTVSSPAFILQPAFGKIGYFGAVLNSTGKGVIIADLDTGADTCHPALKGIFTYNFVTYEPNTPENCPNASTVPGPGYGHGTEVASLLHVLAPESSVWALRVFDSTGTADVATVYEATTWAVDHGANIINMSFGATSNSQALQQAIAYAAAHNVIVTAAAGNSNQNFVMYPAAIQPAIAVTSTDLNDQKSSFSNYGSSVDVSAPGSQLVAAYPGDRWAIVWGTSFASPIVAAEGAMVASSWASRYSSPITSSRLITVIQRAVDNINSENPQYSGELGTGRVDMWKAVSHINTTMVGGAAIGSLKPTGNNQ